MLINLLFTKPNTQKSGKRTQVKSKYLIPIFFFLLSCSTYFHFGCKKHEDFFRMKNILANIILCFFFSSNNIINSDEAKQQIAFILEKISTLRPAEKLLLYLKMPGGHCEVGECLIGWCFKEEI